MQSTRLFLGAMAIAAVRTVNNAARPVHAPAVEGASGVRFSARLLSRGEPEPAEFDDLVRCPFRHHQHPGDAHQELRVDSAHGPARAISRRKTSRSWRECSSSLLGSARSRGAWNATHEDGRPKDLARKLFEQRRVREDHDDPEPRHFPVETAPVERWLPALVDWARARVKGKRMDDFEQVAALVTRDGRITRFFNGPGDLVRAGKHPRVI